MPYQEKKIYVSIFSALIVIGFFSNYIFGLSQDGRFDGADASVVMGKSIIALIFISIAANILLQVIFAIINAIITRESAEFEADERDKQIEQKGMQGFLIAFSVGYVASMAALALGSAPHMVFFGVTASMFFGSIIGDIVKLFFYRRGF